MFLIALVCLSVCLSAISINKKKRSYEWTANFMEGSGVVKETSA